MKIIITMFACLTIMGCGTIRNGIYDLGLCPSCPCEKVEPPEVILDN